MPKVKRCCSCNNFILNIKHYSDSYICSIDGKTMWCDNCFDNYDFSFLFDKEKDIKDEKSTRCLYCAQNFKINSKERYLDQYNSKINIEYNDICSVRCHMNIINYFKKKHI